MDLHVTLKQLLGLETLATVQTRMGLAVDLSPVPRNYPLVRAGEVTLLLVVTLVELNITALFGVVRQTSLKKISVTLQTNTNTVKVPMFPGFFQILTLVCANRAPMKRNILRLRLLFEGGWLGLTFRVNWVLAAKRAQQFLHFNTFII
mgnify:CR=1 FL=1